MNVAEQTKQRLTEAESALQSERARLRTLENEITPLAKHFADARSAAIGATLNVRDLTFCQIAGVIATSDAELLAASNSRAALMRQLADAGFALQQKRAEHETLTRRMLEAERLVEEARALVAVAQTRPELLAEVEEARAEVERLEAEISKRTASGGAQRFGKVPLVIDDAYRAAEQALLNAKAHREQAEAALNRALAQRANQTTRPAA